MGIIVQVIGSLLILIGFVFSQLGKLKTTSLNYLLLNAIGALILGIDAFIGKQWGFVLLEGVWSIVAIQGLVKYFNKKGSLSNSGHGEKALCQIRGMEKNRK